MEGNTPFFSWRLVIYSIWPLPLVYPLQKSSSPDVIFIASRILFLATASSATADSFIISIVERKPSGRTHTLVDIISLRLDSLTSALLNGTRMAREAVVDLLKFAFNILTHYPKVQFYNTSIFPSTYASQLVDCERVVEIGSDDGGVRVMGEYWSDRLHGRVLRLAIQRHY